MPEITSPHWNTEMGVCEKHGLPQVPCLQCLATQDVDVEVHLTIVDILDMDEGIPIQALLPRGQEWLLARVVPPPNDAY